MRLAWIALFYAAYFAYIGLYSPFLGPYLKSIGYSFEVVTWALTMHQITRIVGPFFWGWVADVTGKTVLWLRVGVVAGLLFSILTYIQPSNFTVFMLGLVCLNLSISGLIPMADSFTLIRCGGKPSLYGRVRVFGSVGFIVSVFGFGLWAEYQNIQHYPFWVWLIWCVALVAVFKLKPLRGRKKLARYFVSKKFGLLLLFRHRNLCLFWAASFLMIFAHGVYYAFFSIYLQEYGYSTSILGSFWAFGVFSEIIFFIVQGKVYQRLSHQAWLQWSFFMCVIRFSLIALFPQLFWVVLLSQALHCITFAAHHTASVSWLRAQIPKSHHVRGQAMYATLGYGLGGTSGALFGHFVWASLGQPFVFLMASVSGFIAFLIALNLKKVPK